ncbi:GcrA family cell cycle regulator [Sinorhizobium medicae]
MSEWTEERIEQLKQLQKAGYSASHIASRLGGVSRSAVLGKLHRLGIDPVPKPKAAAKTRAAKLTKPKPMKTPALPQLKPATPERLLPRDFADVVRPKPFLKRIMDADWNGRHECRWPVDGDKEHTRFCCHPVSGESSYCEYHRRAARGHGTESERRVAPMPVKRVA